MKQSFDKQIEYVKNHELGLDDTFSFGCKGCGKCCKHRENILLAAYDLYRIGTYLNRTAAEVLERYCESYIGSDSHIVVTRAKPIPPLNACPFQRGKKCSIHPAKPIVCAAYPLGRAFISTREKPIYFLQPGITCGRMDTTATVRKWIGGFAEEEAEYAGKLWNDVVGVLSAACSQAWNALTPAAKKKLEEAQTELLYLSYDVEQPFIPQFQANAAKLMATVVDETSPDIVPTWLPIQASMTMDAKEKLLVRKSYWKYIHDWCGSRGFSLEDKDSESFPDGTCYVFFEEFRDCEYRDDSYMKQLLDPEDYALWKLIKHKESET